MNPWCIIDSRSWPAKEVTFLKEGFSEWPLKVAIIGYDRMAKGTPEPCLKLKQLCYWASNDVCHLQVCANYYYLWEWLTAVQAPCGEPYGIWLRGHRSEALGTQTGEIASPVAAWQSVANFEHPPTQSDTVMISRVVMTEFKWHHFKNLYRWFVSLNDSFWGIPTKAMAGAFLAIQRWGMLFVQCWAGQTSWSRALAT